MDILTTLKILGIVLTGAFGALALLKDFKDKKKKVITKWGKIALCGMFLSTALAITTQVLESRKPAGDFSSQQILSGINRSMNPIKNVRVTYWLRVPFSAPEFSAYRARLEKGIAAVLASHDLSHPEKGFISRSGPNGPEAVEIPRASPLMPQKSELIPYYALRFSGLHFSFFKNPRPDSDLLGSHGLPPADLSLQVGTDTGEKDSETYSLQYDLKTHDVSIFAMDLFSDPQYWRTNNHIQTVPDLAEDQLAVQIDDTMVPTLPANGEVDPTGQAISHLRSQMQLDSLILKIDTRELWLKRFDRNMKRLESNGARPFALYTTLFPKNVDDLQLSANR